MPRCARGGTSRNHFAPESAGRLVDSHSRSSAETKNEPVTQIRSSSDASAPARDWLSRDGHMLFEGDPQTVQTLIDDFYAAGAPNVWFIGIEQLGQASVSASIAVEMPSDSVTRSQILRTEAKFWHDPESEDEPELTDDVGQRYLVVSFD